MSWSTFIAVSMIALSVTVGASQDPARAQETVQAVDPDASQKIRAMSDFLAAQDAFSFQAEVLDETVFGQKDGDWDLPAEKVSAVRHVSITVQRPNRFSALIAAGQRDFAFLFDGETLVVSDQGANTYVIKALNGTIDQAIGLLRETYQSDPPLSDLMESNLYDSHMEGVSAASYLGPTRLRGQDVHHLAFASPGMDWQVWVADGAQPVPVLLQVIRRDEAYWPTYQAWFTEWNFGAAVAETAFVFDAPEGAIETQFVQDFAASQAEVQQ